MFKATVTSKGQITIPKVIRDTLHLHVGSQLNFVVTPNGEVLLSLSTGSISELKGIIKHTRTKPVSQLEMKKAIRDKACRRIK
jgi:AbrB family looped-hinge helix DNA binding protein